MIGLLWICTHFVCFQENQVVKLSSLPGRLAILATDDSYYTVWRFREYTKETREPENSFLFRVF